MFRRIPTLLALFALLGAALAQSESEVVIGWSGAITGPTSDAGQYVVQGVEDYCKYAQDEGLIPDHTIRCLTSDDQYDNNNTVRNFESYLDQGMDAFLAYATGGALQLKVNAVEEEIPTMSSSLHIGVIDPPDNAYNFLPTTSYSEQVVALLEWIAQNDESGETPKAALFIHPSAFGRAPVEDAQAAAERLGIEITEVQEHGEGLDYTALLQRWDNAGVRYVITQTVQTPVATLLQNAQALGLLDRMQFMGAHYTGSATLINLAGEAAEGFLWATSFAMADEVPWQREVGERYGRGEDTIADVNYTSGLMQAATFVEAARRAAEAGDASSAGIYQALLNMNDEADGAYEAYGLGVGPVSFSDEDRVGVDQLRLLQVQQGAFVPITEPFASELFREIHTVSQ